MARTNIKELLLNRLKTTHDFDLIEVFHYRTMKDFEHSFLDYNDIKALKLNDKSLTDKLTGGFTVVLARNSNKPTEGISSLAICSPDENFNKSLGLEIALKRLDNYLTKKNDNSWDYDPKNYLTFTNLPTNRQKLVNVVSKRLNEHPFFIKKGYKIFNPRTVLNYD